MRACLISVVVALGIVGCEAKDPVPMATFIDAGPGAAPAARALPTAERPLGPTRAACDRAVTQIGKVLAAANPASQSQEQRAYADAFLARMKPRGLGYCLQLAVPKEVECLATAADRTEMATCERFRREVPTDMLDRNDVTELDCARLFDRLRQFKLEEEGADPAEIDQTRDQIVRACQEKGKLGTITCFLASPSYAQARRCP